MFLQSHYKIVATTNLDAVSAMIRNSSADLVIIDSEPNQTIQALIDDLKNIKPNIPIILTYVYNTKLSVSENKIKSYVKDIFYKPFDLNEISSRIPFLINPI
jgi:DNA-binding NtrC family response regulator